MRSEQRKKEILKMISKYLIDETISFKYSNNVINAEGYFKLITYSDGIIEIITNNYNKDFKFLSDNTVEHLLDVIDRIIFNYKRIKNWQNM